MTTTATRSTTAAVFAELSAIRDFLEQNGDLPGASVSAHGFGLDRLTVHLLLDSLADVQAWAGRLGVEVVAREAKAHRQIHHNAHATWGGVSFSMCYVEHVPAPLPVETYTCSRCGATFGIAGGVDGQEYEADDYFASEVERHESGECVTAKVTV